MHHRHLTVLEQAFKTGHARVEAVAVVNFAQLVGADAQLGAQTVIRVICIRHQRVEAVVGTGEFHHHQDAVRVGGQGLNRGQGSAQTDASQAL